MLCDLLIEIAHLVHLTLSRRVVFDPIVGFIFTLDFFILCLNVSDNAQRKYQLNLISLKFDSISSSTVCSVWFPSIKLIAHSAPSNNSIQRCRWVLAEICKAKMQPNSSVSIQLAHCGLYGAREAGQNKAATVNGFKCCQREKAFTSPAGCESFDHVTAANQLFHHHRRGGANTAAAAAAAEQRSCNPNNSSSSSGRYFRVKGHLRTLTMLVLVSAVNGHNDNGHIPEQSPSQSSEAAEPSNVNIPIITLDPNSLQWCSCSVWQRHGTLWSGPIHAHTHTHVELTYFYMYG